MQTILGAGGAIGNELARSLPAYTEHIRLVSRNPQKINESDELFAADLTDKNAVISALEGSEIAYLTVGLPYNTSIWQNYWPVIMRNVIDACKSQSCKLVFFDNIYMYHPSAVTHLTEESRVDPQTKKGKVRAAIAQMLIEEVEAGRLTALIARSADFYGPNNSTSVLVETVVKNLIAGKKASWLASLKYEHSFTFTPDAGRATALLGNTTSAYQQIWHLPTDPKTLSGKEWIELVAKELGVTARSQVATKPLVRVLGLFNPIMKEMVEMMYQYEQDYFFDSKKFDQFFKGAFNTTTYEEGIKQTLASM